MSFSISFSMPLKLVCFIGVVDLVAYFEAERLFFVPNVRVFVSCDQSLFLEERSSCVAHPDPKW